MVHFQGHHVKIILTNSPNWAISNCMCYICKLFCGIILTVLLAFWLKGHRGASVIISSSGIKELTNIEQTNSHLFVGAHTSMSQLERILTLINEKLPGQCHPLFRFVKCMVIDCCTALQFIYCRFMCAAHKMQDKPICFLVIYCHCAWRPRWHLHSEKPSWVSSL